MRPFKKAILFLFILTGQLCHAQNQDVIRKYIDTYKDIAIAEMKRTGVPAAITLAQGIHESGAGQSDLVIASNNHFGIKCKSDWTGESVRHDDDARGECFRKYAQAADSYKDHSDFLKNGQRYAFLFQLDPTDYTGWANGLKKAGYATNPKYPQVLIKLVEDYNLQEYTLLALGKNNTGNDQVVTKVNDHGKDSAVKSPCPPYCDVNDNKAKQVSYPDGLFKLNETKVVFVKKGTSYFAIAKQYDIDLAKIFEFNEMNVAEAADKDQLVYLQRKRKVGYNEFHIVQVGESLHDIAQQEAIRMESLRELNWLREEQVPAPGVTLSLKVKSTSMPKLAVKENFSIIQKPITQPTH